MINQQQLRYFLFSTTAKRVFGYDKVSMFTRFSQLAIQTKSINLGQGFPNFPPPDFLREFLSQNCQTGSLQYQPTAGNPLLCQTISEFFEPIYQRKINCQTDLVVTAGASAVLGFTFLSLINPGDEAVLFDPSFDNYRPQIEFGGGKVRGVPLIPKSKNSQSQMKKRGTHFTFQQEKDDWEIDWRKLSASLNDKTKLIVINTPNNPIGKLKVYSNEELKEIAKLLQKYPKVIVVEDIAYQHIAFSPYTPFQIPMCLRIPELKDRTISVTSAGKLFSATGLRTGWAIGNEQLIKSVRAINQYEVFCLSEPFQVAIAQSLKKTQKDGYFDNTVKLYQNQCNLLLQALTNSKLEMDIWVPQGGYFVLSDISKIQVPEQYYIDSIDGSRLSKDFAFCFWICDKFGVVAIPISGFYGTEDRHLGENQVRWAFCKTSNDLNEAAKRLR